MIEFFDGNCTETNTSPLPELAKIIADSFLSVAKEFNITKQNAPENPAFITAMRLAEAIDNGSRFWIYRTEKNETAGTVCITPSVKENRYFIDRLAVLEKFRHQGYGKQLLDYACREIYKNGGKYAVIAIIDENRILKNWYINYGFTEISAKKIKNMPFTVCIMEKELKGTSFVDESQQSFSF
jgi:N-acetylglutamate synthase-like GNAT family acetyltransferase